MILQSLKNYYDRKSSGTSLEIAPPGFEWKELPFIIMLDQQGVPVSILCTYEHSGKLKRGKSYLVPQSVKKTSGIASNLLWDNPEYALGIQLKGTKERVKKQHDAFCKRVRELGDIPDVGLNALKEFLSLEDKEEVLQNFESWSDIRESGANISFSLVGDTGLIFERPSVKQAILKLNSQHCEDPEIICLITGETQPLQRLHPSIKNVKGAQTSGANIVSFNCVSFASYGKKQGANAPVGKLSAFAYTTALNHLLRRDSPQRMFIGDTTMVFWSEKDSVLEAELLDIFNEPPKDDPDRGTKAVKSLYQAVDTGLLAEQSGKQNFYVLGLSPNAARISIRFWVVDSVVGLAEKIIQHFEDIRIVHGPRGKEILSLFRLLVATASQGKAENISPRLAGEYVRSILSGSPYPRTMLQGTVTRIRADREVTYPRAASIKAYINRQVRFNSHRNCEEELKVSLDKENSNIGYRLGRLFATLEKIQDEANPGINATIRDRFYGAASGTPVTVFSNLMRLKNHHLAKLESKGRRIYFEKLIAEIISSVTDFPAHLTLVDQGRFAVGYYHQVNNFYTKKESNPTENGQTEEGETENE